MIAKLLSAFPEGSEATFSDGSRKSPTLQTMSLYDVIILVYVTTEKAEL